MKPRSVLAALAAATMLASMPLMTHPGFAQSAPAAKPSMDGQAPTQIGPGKQASKQKTDGGDFPIQIGPGSGAYKQKTDGGEGPVQVGPGSGAFKQ